MSAGEALNAAATLGGRGVAALRVSEADLRERHRGLSHHSATAYGRVLTRPADVPLPLGRTGLPHTDACLEQVRGQVDGLLARASHLRVVDVPVDGLLETLGEVPVRLSTMGRGLAEDPASFLASAAAGWHAAVLA